MFQYLIDMDEDESKLVNVKELLELPYIAEDEEEVDITAPEVVKLFKVYVLSELY